MTCFVFATVFGRFRPWESVWQHLLKIPCQPSCRDLLGWSGARVMTCLCVPLFLDASGPGNLSGSISIRYHVSRPIETFWDGMEPEL